MSTSLEINTIEWHKDCLKNAEAYAELLERIAKSKTIEAKQAWASVWFYSEQINRAVARGKKKFDADKFMHTTKPREDGE